MKKCLLVFGFVLTASLSVAQIDTFNLRNMPENYYIKDWSGDSVFDCNSIYYYDDGSLCVLQWINEAPRCLNGLPTPFGGTLQRSILDTTAWDYPHILNYATSKYADSPIDIVGVAMLLPQKVGGQGIWIIRELFMENGFDVLVLQVLDTGMNVVAEGLR